MTVTQPVSQASDERIGSRPRSFSTDRERSLTNGVVVPETLRQKIEASFSKGPAEPEHAPDQSFSGWGFL
jgi:hypothetical protein